MAFTPDAKSILLDRERMGAGTRADGFWRGIIEYNRDPQARGRCKVRVPALHGTQDVTATQLLKWADPCFPNPVGPDFGAFQVPEVGTMVWVAFRQGDPNYPIYVGYFPTIPTSDQLMGVVVTPEGRLPEDGVAWTAEKGPEVPIETQIGKTPATHTIIAKSVTGNEIHMEEEPSREFFEIVDRMGQGLRMDAPMKPLADPTIAPPRRGRLSAFRKPQRVTEDLLQHDESKVRLYDVKEQGVTISSKTLDERTVVVSRAEDGFQEMEFNAGRGRTKFTGVLNGEPVISMVFDSTTGMITISGTTITRIKSQRIVLDAEDISATGDFSVEGDLSVGGDVVAAGKVIQQPDGISAI